jgi:hypothetical protein
MTNGRRSSTGPLEQLERVTASYAQAVGERLSPRDWAVLELVNVLRLISGDQVERLFFSALTGASRPVSRGRMLKRLVAWRVLAILPLARLAHGCWLSVRAWPVAQYEFVTLAN